MHQFSSTALEICFLGKEFEDFPLTMWLLTKPMAFIVRSNMRDFAKLPTSIRAEIWQHVAFSSLKGRIAYSDTELRRRGILRIWQAFYDEVSVWLHVKRLGHVKSSHICVHGFLCRFSENDEWWNFSFKEPHHRFRCIDMLGSSYQLNTHGFVTTLSATWNFKITRVDMGSFPG